MTHTFTAPVAMTPEQHEKFERAVLEAKPGIYVAFTAGRRGAGSVSCQFCGIPLFWDESWTYPLPEDHVWTTDEDEMREMRFGPEKSALRDREVKCERHDPGLEMGPVYGPFEYTELTYQWLRVDDGEHLAVWNEPLGDWVICDDGPYSGTSYSDVTIAHYQPKEAAA